MLQRRKALAWPRFMSVDLGTTSHPRHHRAAPAASTETTTMKEALLAALAKRCPRGGKVILPTGMADAGEVARVIEALNIERAGKAGG
jgi:hypothetical protein